jgi:hypothetical protein
MSKEKLLRNLERSLEVGTQDHQKIKVSFGATFPLRVPGHNINTESAANAPE